MDAIILAVHLKLCTLQSICETHVLESMAHWLHPQQILNRSTKDYKGTGTKLSVMEKPQPWGFSRQLLKELLQGEAAIHCQSSNNSMLT